MSSLNTAPAAAFARSVLAKAAHTAWQAGAATAGVLWATSGLHIADLATAHGWTVLFSSVVIGVLAAALSAAKTVVLGSVTSVGEAEVEKVSKEVAGSIPKPTIEHIALNPVVPEPADKPTDASPPAG